MTMPMLAPLSPAGASAAPAAPEAVVPLTAVHPVARVDLMPPEVRRLRRFRRARRFMVLAVVGVVAVAAAASLAAWQDARAARTELAGEQARTQRLQADAAAFAEVPAVLGSIERARTSLQVATAGEVAWYPVLDDISRSAPETVWFEQITLATVPPGAVTDDPLATPGAVATVAMTGRALDHQDVVAWLDEMGGLLTWTDPVFTESATEQGAATAAPGDPAAGLLTFTASARLSAGAMALRPDPTVGTGPTVATDPTVPGDPAAPTDLTGTIVEGDL